MEYTPFDSAFLVTTKRRIPAQPAVPLAREALLEDDGEVREIVLRSKVESVDDRVERAVKVLHRAR